jgi:TRAP transporter 4TM/12TM fusion protein
VSSTGEMNVGPAAGAERYMRYAAGAIGLSMAAFHLYTALTVVFSPMIQRSVHLAFALSMLFLITPGGGRSGPFDRFTRIAAAILSVVVCVYAAVEFTSPEILRVIDPLPLDLVLGTVLALLLLEGTRRTAGPSLAIVAAVFLAYAFLGPYLPGLIGHPGFSYSQIVSSMFIRLEGIFGTALGSSATYIYVFILFGAFMMRMGGGDFFIRLAQAAIGSSRGAAAKVSVLASALFATITGTGPGNAAAVGTVTIPTMMRAGYSGRIAAALEAAASVGGQIMPPIMGASAFIMADLLNVPYFEIAKAAFIPASMYFIALFVTADLEAARNGLKGTPRDELPKMGDVIREGWHYLVPVGVLIYLLGIEQISPSRAGAWAALSFIPVWLGREAIARRKIQWRNILDALEEASRGAVMIAAACAIIGIVMNVTDLTGLGLKFTSLIVGFSGGTLIGLLAVTALAAILLGTGLPTTATYLIVAILVAPALAKMGVPPIAAHLFVFYFGVISDLTPPTAVSCYVAGGIAGESGMKVSISATRIALPALIVPFMFVYQPALLLQGEWIDIILATAATLAGILALSAALVGYWRHPLSIVERIAAIVAGVLLIFPDRMVGLAGLAILTGLALLGRKNKTPAGAE